jgi:hypothetical protein
MECKVHMLLKHKCQSANFMRCICRIFKDFEWRKLFSAQVHLNIIIIIIIFSGSAAQRGL